LSATVWGMWTSLVATVFGVLLFVSGCGAKVAVDGAAEGGGGAGGSISTSTTSTTETSTVTCDFLCGGPIGVCGCSGACSDGKMRAVACGDNGTGISCACVVDGVQVAACSSPTLGCGLVGGCCEAAFGL
jgi:hypothetical protein